MSNFQIFSDGACDIGKEWAEEYDISLIPFYVSLDHKTYQKEIEELSLDYYYAEMVSKKIYPKTSLPSVQDYIDAFRPALEAGKDIICLTLTRTLSASLESAVNAQNMLQEDFPDAKIHVLNSWHATGSQLLLLMEIAKMRDAGRSIDEAKEYVEKARVDARIHFMVGDISYLEVGGRIGKLATLSGSILKIKPLIILKDGEIGVGGVIRSRKKGIQRIVEITKEYFQNTSIRPEDCYCAIGISNLWDEASECQALLAEATPGLNFLKPFQIGATIATHTGPGTIGICFVPKKEVYGF